MKLRSYSDRDGRPAALFEGPSGVRLALARLEPGSSWAEVDGLDVAYPAGLLSREPSETVLRQRFGWSMGTAAVPSAANLTSHRLSRAAE